MVNKFKILIPILFLLFSINSCKKFNSDKPIGWMNDNKNDMIKNKKQGQFYFEVQFLPETDENNSSHNYYYFKLKIGCEDPIINIAEWKATSVEDVQNNSYYLSYSLQNDIKLIDGEDTLSCIHYLYERSNNLAAFEIFNIGFEANMQTNKDKTLLIDGSFFNTIPIKFKFKESDIENSNWISKVTFNNKLDIKENVI